jgi:phosphoribosyl 1,2-cyclic phosphate phosphodiesterase
MRVTFLGTGTSHGVPSIGCDCLVCRSDDPRDRRTRPSILIETEPGVAHRRRAERGFRPDYSRDVRSILVDTSSDLRAQALAQDVRRVDAILFTHSHADHVFGLDEVRRYNAMQGAPLGCYGDARTLADLRRMFAYIFDPPEEGSTIPALRLFRIGGTFTLGDVDVVPVPLLHGTRPILGFRVGTFAYLTDCSTIPDPSWPLLDGVRTLVLDALRHRPHPTHFSVAEALEVVGRLAPDRAYFTHICHDLPHAATCAHLPPGVELAYDGLVLDSLP